MGKEKPGFLTAKAIGNRIKSKGLQKLRWYCQMCQKQCRDEVSINLLSNLVFKVLIETYVRKKSCLVEGIR